MARHPSAPKGEPNRPARLRGRPRGSIWPPHSRGRARLRAKRRRRLPRATIVTSTRWPGLSTPLGVRSRNDDFVERRVERGGRDLADRSREGLVASALEAQGSRAAGLDPDKTAPVFPFIFSCAASSVGAIRKSGSRSPASTFFPTSAPIETICSIDGRDDVDAGQVGPGPPRAPRGLCRRLPHRRRRASSRLIVCAQFVEGRARRGSAFRQFPPAFEIRFRFQNAGGAALLLFQCGGEARFFARDGGLEGFRVEFLRKFDRLSLARRIRREALRPGRRRLREPPRALAH